VEALLAMIPTPDLRESFEQERDAMISRKIRELRRGVCERVPNSVSGHSSS
jgi:hypothetical protein